MADRDYDPYELISGFYGPGALACWYLMFASVLVTWIFNNPAYRYKISSDLVAFVLFPLIATGHVMYLSFRFPTEHLGYVVADLKRLSLSDYNGLINDFPHDGPFDGDKMTDDSDRPAGARHAHLHPLVMALHVALKLSDIYVQLCCVVLACDGLLTENGVFTLRGRGRPALRLFVASFGWWLLAKFILWLRCLISQDYSMLALVQVMSWLRFMTFATFGLLVLSVLSIVWDNPSMLCMWQNCTPDVGLPLFYCLMLVYWIVLSGWTLELSMFAPKTGISMTDLDQGAALIGGLVSFGASAYSAMKWRKRSVWQDVEAMG